MGFLSYEQRGGPRCLKASREGRREGRREEGKEGREGGVVANSGD